MKVLGGYIIGFGALKDFQFDFGDADLVVIQGPNESGKSTLRAFISFMFFGLPPKKRLQFQPKTGGEVGGRLDIILPGIGKVRIERMHTVRNGRAICTYGSQQYDEDWLQQQIRGYNLMTFQQIYGLDADALAELQLTNKEQLGELLLQAGLTGASGVRQTEKMLHQKLQELYKPQGKKPLINQTLQIFREQQELLDRRDTEEKTYLPVKERIHHLHQRRTALLDKKQTLSKRLAANRLELQAVPIIEKIKQHEQAKEQLAADPNFSLRITVDLEKLNETRIPLLHKYELTKEEMKKRQASVSILKEDLLDQKLMDELEKQLFPRMNETASIKVLKEQEDALKINEFEISRTLAELGIELSPAQLADMKLPFYLESEWETLKENMYETQMQLNQLEQERGRLEMERERSREQQNLVQDRMVSEQEFREMSAGRVRTGSDLAVEHQLQQKRKTKRIAAAGAVFACISAAGGLLFSMPMLYWAAAVIGSFSAAAYYHTIQMIRTLQRLLYASAGAEHVTDERFVEQKQLRQEWLELEKECDGLAARIKENDRLLTIVRNEQQSLTQTVPSYTADYPFLMELNVSHWPKLYQKLSNLQQKISELMAKRKQLDEAYLQRTRLASRCRHFLERAGIQENSQFDWEKLITEVFEDQKAARHRLQQAEKWLEENKQQQSWLAEELAPVQRKYQLLLQEANAADEASVFKLAEKAEKDNFLRETIDQLRAQATAIMPMEAVYRDRLTIQMDSSEAEEAIKETEQELEEVRQELASSEAIRTRMEHSSEASDQYHTLMSVQEKLREQVRQWAVYKLGSEMLALTKQRYQQDYLPRVLTEASSMMSRITFSSFEVLLDEDDKIFISKAGERFQVQELSRGTCEQLYLSLRLALSRTASGKQTYPFMMDDALTHSDKIRKKELKPVIEAASEHQQILLFTWDDFFAHEKSPAKIIQLQPYFKEVPSSKG